MERSDIRDSSRVARAPRVSLRSTRATNCRRGEGPTRRQRHAPQAREPNEFARAANFLLTRVTRIFQESVFTEIAPGGRSRTLLRRVVLPARGCRRGEVRNATDRCRNSPPGQPPCFRPVLYRDRYNFNVSSCLPWLGAQQ